ncbi:MAG: hypothetical protein NTV09_09135 [Bacteroidetes bacterium]|nr:hypothetical protein [Bacteroidota bacterium]
MSKVTELKNHLKRGEVYRRSDLAQWSKAVDRHVVTLVKNGTLQKLSTGLYYYPNTSLFGNTPPDEAKLVRNFLKDDYFLVTSPNDYNSLGVGTTQLYNKQVVYNHKRHGDFKLGGKTFTFLAKHRFPKKATPEFLLVDLVNNLGKIAEDAELVLKNVLAKVKTMDHKKLKRTLKEFGSAHTKSLLTPHLQD